jgi:cyclophilin family peptidyl-prolyl cis-trans isomerase
MAKTRSKKATTARQTARVRQQHGTVPGSKALRPNPVVRRAAQKRRQRTGLSAFVHDFPVLTSAILLAAIIGLGVFLHNDRLLFFAPGKAAADPCAWANNPSSFHVTGAVTHHYSSPPRTCIVKTSGGSYWATIQTKKGTIVVELDQSSSPATVNNFVFLATHRFYDNLTFHRVVSQFVIQAGDPRSLNGGDTSAAPSNGDDGPGYVIPNEFASANTIFVKGCVAMANKNSTGDASAETTGSQFFICTADDTNKLTTNYNYFGRVVSGMDVAQQIQQGDVIQSITIHYEKTETPGVYPITPTATSAPTVTPTP